MAVAVEVVVRRLEVAVDDAVTMSVVHGPGRVADHAGALPGRQRSLGEDGGEARPVDVAHREVMQPLMLADLEERHDAGVIELGGGACLRLESANHRLRSERSGRDHLEGDDPAERAMPGLEDDAHAAAAEDVEELVFAAGSALERELLAGAVGLAGCSGGSRPERIVVGRAGRERERRIAALSVQGSVVTVRGAESRGRVEAFEIVEELAELDAMLRIAGEQIGAGRRLAAISAFEVVDDDAVDGIEAFEIGADRFSRHEKRPPPGFPAIEPDRAAAARPPTEPCDPFFPPPRRGSAPRSA